MEALTGFQDFQDYRIHSAARIVNSEALTGLQRFSGLQIHSAAKHRQF
jgi:hypothetical protein